IHASLSLGSCDGAVRRRTSRAAGTNRAAPNAYPWVIFGGQWLSWDWSSRLHPVWDRGRTGCFAIGRVRRQLLQRNHKFAILHAQITYVGRQFQLLACFLNLVLQRLVDQRNRNGEMAYSKLRRLKGYVTIF